VLFARREVDRLFTVKTLHASILCPYAARSITRGPIHVSVCVLGACFARAAAIDTSLNTILNSILAPALISTEFSVRLNFLVLIFHCVQVTSQWLYRPLFIYDTIQDG
jgi:hypothetical protein